MDSQVAPIFWQLWMFFLWRQIHQHLLLLVYEEHALVCIHVWDKCTDHRTLCGRAKSSIAVPQLRYHVGSSARGMNCGTGAPSWGHEPFPLAFWSSVPQLQEGGAAVAGVEFGTPFLVLTCSALWGEPSADGCSMGYKICFAQTLSLAVLPGQQASPTGLWAVGLKPKRAQKSPVRVSLHRS